MISPRGGSNYMTQAEAMLSSAGPHANDALVKQAREYRHGLVGGLHTGKSAAPSTTAPAPDAPDTATPAPKDTAGGSAIPSRYGIEPVRSSAPSKSTSSSSPSLSDVAQTDDAARIRRGEPESEGGAQLAERERR
jgi:hypothetical protein